MNDYDRFSNRFVDKIKVCIANIIVTFLQSAILLTVVMPFNNIDSLFLLLREEKFGIKVAILVIIEALGKLCDGHDKTKWEIFSTLFSLHFSQMSVLDNPVIKQWEFRKDLPTRRWVKYLFPILDPYLKCRFLIGL